MEIRAILRVKKKLPVVRNVINFHQINKGFYISILIDTEFVLYIEFDSCQMTNALRMESNTMEESMPEGMVSLKQILSNIANWFVRQLIIVTFSHLQFISKDVCWEDLSKGKLLMEITSREELTVKKKVRIILNKLQH